MFWPDSVFYILTEKGFLAKQIDICVVAKQTVWFSATVAICCQGFCQKLY
jgi:hypothetical protein